MSEETPKPNRPAAGKGTRGGAAGARPAGARPAGARPAGARGRGGKAAGQGARDQGAAGQGEAVQKPPEAKLKKFSPVYIIKNEQTEQTCTLCRNDLTDVCNVCKTQGITDPALCIVVTGKCGHIFHSHCIEGWIKAGHPDCPYPGCQTRWENA